MRTVRHDKSVHYDFAERREQLRTDLYRAIYSGNANRAIEIADMMAMVDIDRDIIWSAKRG